MNRSLYNNPLDLLPRMRISLKRGTVFGILIVGALFSFEIFNYSTTEYSLRDLLGDLQFMGIAWATILSIAFCSIDFAGLARLFTPEQGSEEPAEVWYLFGAWLLAALMNATLTWWGVSVAILNHPPSANSLVDRNLILKVVPVFVAIMVFLIRVLIIGTFSVAGERIFTQSARRVRSGPSPVIRPTPLTRPAPSLRPEPVPARSPTMHSSPAPMQTSFRPAPRPASSSDSVGLRPEPTYHPISMSSGRRSEDHSNLP